MTPIAIHRQGNYSRNVRLHDLQTKLTMHVDLMINTETFGIPSGGRASGWPLVAMMCFFVDHSLDAKVVANVTAKLECSWYDSGPLYQLEVPG
jgi:hypothetical protein